MSIILGIMALPTIVSVSEDALQAAGRELREGSYALGATRAETIIKTVIPGPFGGHWCKTSFNSLKIIIKYFLVGINQC